MAAPRTALTVEEFLTHPAADQRSELVHGEVRMNPPASGPHGLVSGRVLHLLIAHVSRHGLGQCFADSTGFRLPRVRDTVRAPDASFVSAKHLPAEGVGAGFLNVAPDLAVEVLSPSETPSNLEEKLDDYRRAGTSLVWIIDPATHQVTVVSVSAPTKWLSEMDTLDGGDVVPGFSCRIADLFDGLAPQTP